MNLSWLDDFLALAASGNFSRAADARHMTQPAFSRRIRALEAWVGTELFDRSSQPAELTPAGEWFRDTARELLDRVARVPAQAQAVAQSEAAELKLAATHALSFTFLPGWLRGLESHVAVGPVRLVSDVLGRCESLLLAGKVDFVLSHDHPQVHSELRARDYPSRAVGCDVLLPVSAANTDGHARYTLTAPPADDRIPLLDYSPESGLGRILAERRRQTGAARPTHSVFTAHLASVLRTMALDGRGIAWLPQTLIADDLAAGRLVEAGADADHIAMEIRLYRDREPIAAASETFWAAVTAPAGPDPAS